MPLGNKRKKLIMEFVIIDADNQRHIVYDSYDLLMFLYVIFVTINQYWDLPLLCGKIN